MDRFAWAWPIGATSACNSTISVRRPCQCGQDHAAGDPGEPKSPSRRRPGSCRPGSGPGRPSRVHPELPRWVRTGASRPAGGGACGTGRPRGPSTVSTSACSEGTWTRQRTPSLVTCPDEHGCHLLGLGQPDQLVRGNRAPDRFHPGTPEARRSPAVAGPTATAWMESMTTSSGSDSSHGVDDLAHIGRRQDQQAGRDRPQALGRAGAPGGPTPRPRPAGPGARRRPGRPGPGAGGWTCRCPARRRAG